MRARGGFFHRFHLLTDLLSGLLLLRVSALNAGTVAWALSYLVIGGLHRAGVG